MGRNRDRCKEAKKRQKRDIGGETGEKGTEKQTEGKKITGKRLSGETKVANRDMGKRRGYRDRGKETKGQRHRQGEMEN